MTLELFRSHQTQVVFKFTMVNKTRERDDGEQNVSFFPIDGLEKKKKRIPPPNSPVGR
jgi:hypothetical protein